MAHTYVRTLVHSIFSTKGRVPTIKPEWQQQLWAYMGGIARENGFHAMAVGGTDNHAHALLSLRSDISVAKAMQLIKGGSSRWLHEAKGARSFAWQDGYGAFSISQSHLEATIKYIMCQAEHHRRRTFEQEWIAILRKHGIATDSPDTFG